MSTSSDPIPPLIEAILENIAPLIQGVEVGVAVSALVSVTTEVVATGLGCDQATAIKLIAATFEGAAAEAGPTEH